MAAMRDYHSPQSFIRDGHDRLEAHLWEVISARYQRRLKQATPRRRWLMNKVLRRKVGRALAKFALSCETLW